MIAINLSADLGALKRRLDDVSRRQLPFAAAQALTATAKRAGAAEAAAMQQSLDRPRPFTLRGVSWVAARKERPTAWVFIKDIQAHYLAPSIVGGPQLLNRNRAILDPVDVKLDQYGNIPRRLLARLRGRKDVFVGVVKGVNGVWQRRPGHGLVLLIRFVPPKQLKVRYPFGQATLATARREFPRALDAALTKALASAR